MSGTYWEYFPELLGNNLETRQLFQNLLKELKEHVSKYSYKINGKSYPSTRESCLFMSREQIDLRENSMQENNYRQINILDWGESENIRMIKQKLEDRFGLKFDYCLAHIYRDGKSSIAWHNDKEALNQDVVSVSLGQTRKFRFRKIFQTIGWETELDLKSGDVVWMKPGCQERYKHCVPKESKVTGSRINLTFRIFEN